MSTCNMFSLEELVKYLSGYSFYLESWMSSGEMTHLCVAQYEMLEF